MDIFRILNHKKLRFIHCLLNQKISVVNKSDNHHFLAHKNFHQLYYFIHPEEKYDFFLKIFGSELKQEHYYVSRETFKDIYEILIIYVKYFIS